MSARKRPAQKRSNRNGSRRKRKTVKTSEVASNAQAFGRLREWFLPDSGIFSCLNLHGNTKWLPEALVWLALCWAWSESKNVTDAFEGATTQCKQLGITSLSTYQGFMNALLRWTNQLMSVLWPILHQRMQQIGGTFWQIGEWVPIAFDGSRSTAPRTLSNEKAFCASNYGTGKTAKYRKKKTKGMRRTKNKKNKPQPPKPQAWITLMWHMGVRLPWMWRLGPSNSSERAHVTEMLTDGDFPENTLFCGDAGFVGYPLWSDILTSGFHFLIRVGANVSLLTKMTDCRIEKNGTVLCWPKAVMRSGQAPLQLRLVKVTIGTTQMWMLTSVLEPARLTKNQIVQFYKMRWGIEVEFRGLKQTLNRATLRCHNDQRLLAELNWSIMAMAVAELFALKEQLTPTRSKSPPDDPPGDPKRRSLANTIRALRSCLNNLRDTPEPGQDLFTRLRQAVTDSYVRKSSKRSRYHPPHPDKKPLGDPKLRKLTTQEKEKLNAFTTEKLVA